MDLKEIGLEDVDWIDLAQDNDKWQALWTRQWTVMNLRVPKNTRDYMTSWEAASATRTVAEWS
jgi:hypothetical protein